MKKSFGSDKPRRFAPSADRKFSGSKPGFKPKKFGDKPSGRDSRDEQGSRDNRSFGDKPAWKSDRPTSSDSPYQKPGGFRSERPSWKSDRPGGGDRPRERGDGDRRPYGDKGGFKSGKPAWKSDKRDWNSDREGSRSGKPAYRSDKGGFKSDRPAWNADKPKFSNDRPKWNSDKRDVRSGPSGYRAEQDRSDRPAWKTNKPGYGSDRPAWKSDKPRGGGDRPDWNRDKPARSFDRPKWNADRPDHRSSDRPKWGGDKPDYRASDRPKWNSDRPDNRSSDRLKWNADRPDRRPDRPDWKKSAGTSGYSDRDESRSYEQRSRDYIGGKSDYRVGTGKNFGQAGDAKRLVAALSDTQGSSRLTTVFDSMILELPDGEAYAGETVYVFDKVGQFVGSAVYNSNSTVRARVFSAERRQFNEAYLREAIGTAVTRRRKMGLLDESCRIIDGDGDGIPGLYADKLGDYLVIQVSTFAADRNLNFIIDQLNSKVAPLGIVARRDMAMRVKEGLAVDEPIVHGEAPEQIEISEAGLVLFASGSGNSKVATSLDQRQNRSMLKPYCNGARVLDLYSGAGAWSIRAAGYGAAEVVGIDSSQSALKLARSAVAANGFDNVSFIEDDVTDYLGAADAVDGQMFDVIICNPPVFASNRKHFEEAKREYTALNAKLMKRLNVGGVLITSSSSPVISMADFSDALIEAAKDSNSGFQILERRGAAPDFPAILGMPDTDYLKCFVLQKIR